MLLSHRALAWCSFRLLGGAAFYSLLFGGAALLSSSFGWWWCFSLPSPHPPSALFLVALLFPLLCGAALLLFCVVMFSPSLFGVVRSCFFFPYFLSVRCNVNSVQPTRSAIQYSIASHPITSQYSTMQYNTVQCTALHCTTLHYTTSHKMI